LHIKSSSIFLRAPAIDSFFLWNYQLGFKVPLVACLSGSWLKLVCREAIA